MGNYLSLKTQDLHLKQVQLCDSAAVVATLLGLPVLGLALYLNDFNDILFNIHLFEGFLSFQ